MMMVLFPLLIVNFLLHDVQENPSTLGAQPIENKAVELYQYITH